MTHITKEQAIKLARGAGFALRDHSLASNYKALCNAAIDHCIEQSVSELTGTAYKMPPDLSAELPEPYVWGVPGYGDVGYYSRDQLTAALAARDAEWQGFELDYLAKCKELDILQAERDAVQADLNAELRGNGELRKKYGALGGETMFDFVARVVSERDAAIQDLHDEKNRGLALLEDAKHWMREVEILKCALADADTEIESLKVNQL